VIAVSAEPEGISRAAEAIRSGLVVAYPTETVYGLGVDPFSEKALDRLFAVKQRHPSHPVLLIVSGLRQLDRVVATMSDRAQAVADEFWPGPVSLVLPKAPGVPDRVTARDKVCVRWPASAVAQELCRAVGSPITSTSANRSGEPPARAFTEVALPGVAVGIDGGALDRSEPSTLYDPDERLVLREGVVPASALEAVRPKNG
jgi:L-threonylcarbamoyladenylate synthase